MDRKMVTKEDILPTTGEPDHINIRDSVSVFGGSILHSPYWRGVSPRMPRYRSFGL